MSPNPTRRVKQSTKAATAPATGAASTLAPGRLTKRVAKLLPLSWRTKIRLLLARLWAKLKTWRLRRRAPNV